MSQGLFTELHIEMKEGNRYNMSKRVNKKYKDRLFRFIFKEKRELLTLYNALNGTHYTDPE